VVLWRDEAAVFEFRGQNSIRTSIVGSGFTDVLACDFVIGGDGRGDQVWPEVRGDMHHVCARLGVLGSLR
jgi:hypothetical protein